jgi:hypothetical protein
MVFDANPMYEAMGKYVIAFQWFVNRLWLAASFAEHPSQNQSDRWALVDLSVGQLISRFEKTATAFVLRWAPDEANSFSEVLKALVDKCHAARLQRNRLLHSAYVHLEAGGELYGIMRSDITWRGATDSDHPSFDQEIASPQLFAAELDNVVQTGIEVNQLYLQLIHWYGRTGG